MEALEESRTRVNRLLGQGIFPQVRAYNRQRQQRPWRMSQAKWMMIAMLNRYFEKLGLVIPWD